MKEITKLAKQGQHVSIKTNSENPYLLTMGTIVSSQDPLQGYCENEKLSQPILLHELSTQGTQHADDHNEFLSGNRKVTSR